jgi:hypothetical protein
MGSDFPEGDTFRTGGMLPRFRTVSRQNCVKCLGMFEFSALRMVGSRLKITIYTPKVTIYTPKITIYTPKIIVYTA